MNAGILFFDMNGEKYIMEQYYYNHMTKTEQEVYYGIMNGVTNYDTSILLPALDIKDVQNVFFLMRLDHPEIFYVTGFKYSYYRDSPNIIFTPEYLFEKAKIKEHQKALKARIDKLALKAKNECKTELEKELFIHDFICENITYDKLKKPYSHEIIGPLGHGVGVCEGIAISVKALCDALGIWCIIAICGNNPQKGIKYRHTWNIVKINNIYYHLDATFDNTVGRNSNHYLELNSGSVKSVNNKNKKSEANSLIRYDYFNLDDKAIFRDHEPLIASAPKCNDANHYYYKEKKLSFTKMDEVLNRATQAAKKGKILTFNWRGGYLTKEVLKEIVDTLKKAGEERKKEPYISLNWSQAVIRVIYTDAVIVKEAVNIEEVNEGENDCE